MVQQNIIKNVSVPAYKSSITSVVLQKQSICTCETTALAIWIRLILHVDCGSTQTNTQGIPWIWVTL